MANGIKRKRLLGIAKQTDFNVPASTATFWLPIIDFSGGEEVQYVENEAFTGSIYKANDAKSVMRMAKPSFSVKVSEREFPILLGSFGQVNSSTVTGETAVYKHTITFTNSNTKRIYTLFLYDPDRNSLIYSSFRIDSLNISFEKGNYITCEVQGLSRYPATATFSPTLNEWLEFTSVHSDFYIADEGQPVQSIKLLSATLNHSFNLSDDSDNFYLGDYELRYSYNKEAEFSHEVTLHFPDLSFKNKWSDGTKQAFRAEIIDTSRNVQGSEANTKPLIRFDYPSAYLSGWSEEGSAGDLLKQKLNIKVLDNVAIPDAPVRIEVVNNVSNSTNIY